MLSKNVNPEFIITFEPSSTYSSNTNDTEIVDEWSAVPKIEFSDFSTQPNNNQQQSTAALINSKPNTSHLVGFNYVNNEFTKMYLTNEFLSQQARLNINNRNENFFQKLVTNLFGPEKLRNEFKQTVDFIYLLASKQLDDNCLLHTQILITLYRKIIGTSIDCPRYGSHWETIGFQGRLKIIN